MVDQTATAANFAAPAPALSRGLARVTAAVGFVWALFAVGTGIFDVVNAWSEYDAIVAFSHGQQGFAAPGADMLPTLSALTFLVWLPVTGMWLALSAALFLSGQRTARRLIYPAAVAAVVTAVVLFALGRSSSLPTQNPFHPHLLTARFGYSALTVLDGLVAIGLAVWLFWRTRSVQR